MNDKKKLSRSEHQRLLKDKSITTLRATDDKKHLKFREEYGADLAIDWDAWGDWHETQLPEKTAKRCSGMRILHVANTQFFIENQLAAKLKGIENAGCKVYTAAAKNPKKADCEFTFYNVDIPRSIRPFKSVKAFFQLINLCHRLQPDLVHTHSSVAGFIGRLAAKAANIPCFHTVHGLPFYEGQNIHLMRFYLYLERFASKFCMSIFSQNREDIITMRKAKFKAPIYFEGNGIDCASIEKLSDRESARKELKLKKDDIAFAMIARWEPVKGQLHFIRAFEKLCVDHENCVAVLVGENMGLGGKYARRVQAAIDQSPYKDRIRVLGMRDDAVRILSGCDILSLPSKKEGIPRVVMEAMALNLPVIATNVPGTRELVVHGKTGLLSAYGDVVGLAINMEILLELPDARKKLGDAGKALIHSQYRESQVIARILAAYDQVKSESFDSIAQDTRC